MAETDFQADLSFLHLSDIHFRKGHVGDAHDIDADLRNELERDLRIVVPHRIKRLDVALTRAMRDTTGNLPRMPGVFPDYLAPIVRNARDGVRELALARWGM